MCIRDSCNDVELAEYQALVDDKDNPVHIVKKIMAAMNTTSAKTVNVTIYKDGEKFSFKTAAQELRRDCKDYYSTWNIVAADRLSLIHIFSGDDAEEINQQEYGWVSAFAAHSYRFVKRLTKEERRKWGYAGVWEISVPEQAGGPQPVPVELPWRCIKMHSDPGGLILDPFCGGGTTLIAAEQSGRRCFAMDSDPLNCDLTVLRWEQFTGKKARRMKK